MVPAVVSVHTGDIRLATEIQDVVKFCLTGLMRLVAPGDDLKPVTHLDGFAHRQRQHYLLGGKLLHLHAPPVIIAACPFHFAAGEPTRCLR